MTSGKSGTSSGTKKAKVKKQTIKDLSPKSKAGVKGGVIGADGGGYTSRLLCPVTSRPKCR